MSTARRVRFLEFASRSFSRLFAGRFISAGSPAPSTRRVSPPVSDDFRQHRGGLPPKTALGLPWSPVLLFFVLATLHLSLATASFAQVGDATLSGIISDPKGAVVPDTEITISRIETGTVLTTRTNGAGVYVFTALQQGHYHLVLNKPGFKEIAIKDFELHTQDKLEQNFSLEIGSQSETVTVTAEATNVSPAVSMTVDREFIGNMPLNGRSFQDLIQLAPGIASDRNGDYSVNGLRTDANSYMVDGVAANLGDSFRTAGSSASGVGLAG